MKSSEIKPRIVLDLLPFHPMDGGLATRIYDLLETCSHLPGFDFSIVYSSCYREMFSTYTFEKIAIVFPGNMRFFISSLVLPGLLRLKKYDGLHCEIGPIPYFVGIPASTTVHDLYFLINKNIDRGGLKNEVNRFYWGKFFVGSLSRAKVLGAVSETTRNDVCKYTRTKKRIIVVYPVIKKPIETIPIRSWPDKCSPIRILFIGNIIPRKNLPFLLEALANFDRKWILDIVGNIWWGLEELKPYLINNERIKMRGYVNDQNRIELMKAAHLIIVPSLYEGFGLTAAEGISYGCLALTSRGSAFDEYVPDECRFDLDSPGRLTAILNKLTSDTYEEMVERSKSNIKKFSLASQIECYTDLFNALVRRTGNDQRTLT
jgi:glycosyltransferase involved in cell wall biosynthesis